MPADARREPLPDAGHGPGRPPEFGLVAPLGGRHHWEALPSRLLFHSNHLHLFKLYHYLLYNTAI